jgi:hypothetical protein
MSLLADQSSANKNHALRKPFAVRPSSLSIHSFDLSSFICAFLLQAQVHTPIVDLIVEHASLSCLRPPAVSFSSTTRRARIFVAVRHSHHFFSLLLQLKQEKERSFFFFSFLFFTKIDY